MPVNPGEYQASRPRPLAAASRRVQDALARIRPRIAAVKNGYVCHTKVCECPCHQGELVHVSSWCCRGEPLVTAPCPHPPSRRSEALLVEAADYCAACGAIVFHDGRPDEQVRARAQVTDAPDVVATTPNHAEGPMG